MLAPRRIGKTWLMDRVKEDLESQDIRVAKLEVAGLHTEAEFLAEICKAIEKAQGAKERAWTQIVQRLKQLTGGVDAASLVQAIAKLDHRQFLETLVESLDAEGVRTVILIDEIALFVHELARKDPDAARRLLYQIRKLWQNCKNVVWFLTGSIGLDEIGRRHGMAGALLGIELFPLEPFTLEQGLSLFEELQAQRIVSSFSFADGAFEHLATELGWLSPYHLEHLLRLIPFAPGGAQASKAEVDAAFEKILSPAYRTHFAGWDEHIDKNFPQEDATLMFAVLEIACETADGEIEATYLARLATAHPALTRRNLLDSLTALASDAYLVQDRERWRFQSGLLRRYWSRYVV